MGRNEVNNLKPNEDGYYTVLLGPLGEEMIGGRKYNTQSVLDAFTKRCESGVPMYVEYGSPNVKGLDFLRTLDRARVIHEDRICGAIVSGQVEITPEAILLKGSFKPTGPLAKLVVATLLE